MTEVILFGGCHMQAMHFLVAVLCPTLHVSQTIVSVMFIVSSPSDFTH